MTGPDISPADRAHGRDERTSGAAEGAHSFSERAAGPVVEILVLYAEG